jgi:ParB-like chromosome segregation protein Spo0J
VFLKPKKIIFNTLIQTIKLDSLKPRQLNLNNELINQLKIDIKQNGLLCPLVVHSNKTLLDGHHRYEAIKDYCTETLVYVVKDKDMENLLSKVNSYMWFDTKGKLND